MATRSTSLLETVKRVPYRQSDMMRTRVVDYTIKTKKDEDMKEEEERDEMWGIERITTILSQVMERIASEEHLVPGDHISMTIYGGDLDYPIDLHIRSYHSVQHHSRLLLNAIESVQQSKRDWMMGCSLDIKVTVVKDPKGKGKKPQTIMTRDLIESNLRSGIFHSMRNEEEEGDVRSDVINILKRKKDLEPIFDNVLKNEDTWQDLLKRWCGITNEGIMVLSQKNGEGTHHVKEWVSAKAPPDNTMVLWYDIMKDKMYIVTKQDCIYRTYRHCLCMTCGVTYDNRSLKHNCEDMSVQPYRVGVKRPHYKCSEHQKDKKTSRLIDNEHENCLGRALFFAMSGMRNVIQIITLRSWIDMIGMGHTWNEPCGLEDVKKWSSLLNKHYGEVEGVELCVYDERNRRVIARFKEDATASEVTPIYLNLADDHFEWIKSMPAWLGRNFFCTKCQKGYDRKEGHKCVRPCLRCDEESVDHYQPNEELKVTCEKCSRTFWSRVCYESHLKIRNRNNNIPFSSCQRKYKCKGCGVTCDRLSRGKLKKEDDHVCYRYNCGICKEKDVIRGEHDCFVLPINDEIEEGKEEEGRPFRLAFFDFETRCLEDHHVVNKVVVLLVCHECVDSIEDHESTGCTGTCGRKRLITFETVQEFVDWMLGRYVNRNSMYTFMAHNLKGYDAYPLLEVCVNQGIQPTCVYQGAKVITMTIRDITFKDSLCFIPMALRKFPSTFGTSGGEKGYFPHFFNTLENANYEGPYPELSYYGIDDMEKKEKDELTEWWREQDGKTFNLQVELTRYCIQDVMVMARGCLKFRDLYVNKFNVDPFAECVTIASTCLTVFKKNFLEEDTMGVVPPLGYRQRDIQSVEAMEWLYSLKIPNLRWACSEDGESMIAGGKVDGYDEAKKTIYQYHGCYWHGCNVCFKNAQHVKHVQLGMTMSNLWEKTNERTQKLRKLGYRVVEMWGHVWNVKRLEMPPIPSWITNQLPILPREALKGGRTNATQLYAVCKDASNVISSVLREKTAPVDRIRYIDVVSLYPTVMWEEEYPKGHPILKTSSSLPDVNVCTRKIRNGKWFGIVKCDVDPPRALYMPVLPRISNQKLMFTLCSKCSDEMQMEKCTHDLEDRRLKGGVWTTCELRKAIEKGYVLHAVHEVWHYEDRSKELFKPYIRENLKIKMEASGWPAHCQTEEQKRQFIEDVKENKGIELAYDNVIKNSGLRSVAKLNLNSLWGKFGQNSFRRKVEYVTDPERFFDMLHDDSIQVKTVLLLNETMVQVGYEEFQESVRANPNGNVVVASFVTAWARLRLYEKLDKLNERVLYHDTDSIIYTTTGNQEEIEIGDRLGQWSDECGDSNTNWIEEFVSLGPKTYAYRTKKGECVVKCKGISLTPGAKQVVHMKSMIYLLLHEDKNLTVNYPRKIIRDTTAKQLKTVSMNKDLRLVYTKRQRQPMSIVTLPFGY